jgi:DNA-directed RNA polymerase
MIVPPVDWTNPFDGGYYDLPLTLVKNKDRDKVGRAYLQELANRDMPQVYEAVNTLQRTPWRVNRNVFEVVHKLFFSDEFKGNIAGLPPRDRFEKPVAGPEFYTDLEYKKAHKRELAKIEELNNQLDSKRIATAAQIETAEMFLEEPEFFFPYQLDFRGRVYPVPARLNPQGEDSARAMLEFANGLPIGRDGGKWLAIHGANMYGVDKVSFDDRVKWVLDNERIITETVVYPFDNLSFWTKADKPFQFLAFCFEWVSYLTHLEEGKFMDSFISRLPIAMDGSNNGIQNLSAMGRDVNAAAFVNLIPSDIPQDIYQLVADRVIEAVKADYNNPDPKRRAQAYGWEGHITRKIVKRPIMTMPYGVTQYGMIDQIQQELVSMQLQGKCPFSTDCRAEAAYLSVKLREVLGDTVSSAVGVMTWLQEVARVVANDGLPIVWKTPIGFHVQQNYRKLSTKRIQTLLGGARVKSIVSVPTNAIDVKSMSRGISPNLVHSFDASHMMDTILRCKAQGVTDFQMIHDSYGTHACNAGLLARELREAFISQYTPDRLMEFVEQLREQVGEDSRPNLIDPPEYGTLDINVVRDSLYFFA